MKKRFLELPLATPAAKNEFDLIYKSPEIGNGVLRNSHLSKIPFRNRHYCNGFYNCVFLAHFLDLQPAPPLLGPQIHSEFFSSSRGLPNLQKLFISQYFLGLRAEASSLFMSTAARWCAPN